MVTLRPYQQEAVERIREELAKVRATLLVLATGLGKTVTFSECARLVAARGGRTLVLAHRGELVVQARATLEDRFCVPTGVEQGKSRLEPRRAPQAVVASVQTLQAARLRGWPRDAFKLVVVDEAHHAVAKSYRTILDHFAPAKVLGVTATPDRADKAALGQVFDSCAYRMDIGDGIKGGWLSRLELRTVQVEGLDLSAVRTVAGDYSAGDLEAQLLADSALHEVSSPLAELARGRQTLVFTAGVQQAYALCRVLQGYGVRAAAVDGSMASDERARVTADYRAGRVQVVANAMLWTEGFDAPETSCIALVRPTRSRSLLAQMIGRGTRQAEGKDHCLVLDFVPSRAGKFRLAAPADVLAGDELDPSIAERVAQLSADEGADLEGLIEQAQREKAELSERAQREKAEALARIIQEGGGIEYVAHRLDVESLLSAGDDPPGSDGPRATEAQLDALRKAGFEVSDELNRWQASRLFDVISARRSRGLCTLKQARRLRSYGLRDDMVFGDARDALDAIANNGWRPPLWMHRDPRYGRCADTGAANDVNAPARGLP